MEEVISLLELVSLESLFIGIVTFLVTMLIRKKIKFKTNKLKEEKRKLVNSILIIIPLCISMIISFIYMYSFNVLELFALIECGCNAWFISMSVYAVYERIGIVIKGVLTKSEDVKVERIKESINSLKKVIKEKEKKMRIVKGKIDGLVHKRDKETSLGIVLKINRELNSYIKKEIDLKEEVKLLKEGRNK